MLIHSASFSTFLAPPLSITTDGLFKGNERGHVRPEPEQAPSPMAAQGFDSQSESNLLADTKKREQGGSRTQ